MTTPRRSNSAAARDARGASMDPKLRSHPSPPADSDDAAEARRATNHADALNAATDMWRRKFDAAHRLWMQRTGLPPTGEHMTRLWDAVEAGQLDLDREGRVYLGDPATTTAVLAFLANRK